MGLFEPEIVLHAIDHNIALDKGYFCWCIPQEKIDWYFKRNQAFLHGYNLDDPEDFERWKNDTYGRHDPEQLGIKAIRYGVTVWECHNGFESVPVYGRHRSNENAPALRCCGRLWAHSVHCPTLAIRRAVATGIPADPEHVGVRKRATH